MLRLTGWPLPSQSPWAGSKPNYSLLTQGHEEDSLGASGSCGCSQKGTVCPCRAVPLLIREIHFTPTLGEISWDRARARWALSLLKAWLLPGNICKDVFCKCMCVCACVCVHAVYTHPTHIHTCTHTSLNPFQLQHCLYKCSTIQLRVNPSVARRCCASHPSRRSCCSYSCFSLLPGAAHPLQPWVIYKCHRSCKEP